MNKEVFKNKNIVIGITGSIACYKTLELIKELKKFESNIHVIVTKSASNLIDTNEFDSVSNNPVQTELFDKKIDFKSYIKENKEIKHITLADLADIFLICPASANILGKVANGIADDLLSTSILATSAPVLICPAMNVKMWKNPITQNNISKLKNINYHFVPPEYGDLACGYKGMGRLANFNTILENIYSILNKSQDLKNKKILITSGPTSEPIDPVRFITNKSSGKMGASIAEQAFIRGADVILLRSKNSKEPSYNIKEDYFSTGSELFENIKKYIKEVDIFIHTAAVSDFTTEKQDIKIKSNQQLNLELQPTTKIFEKLKSLNKKMFLVGFKAEYNLENSDLIDSAYNILQKANADLVVANDISKSNSGFDSDLNEVIIVDKNKKTIHQPLQNKKIIADSILDEVIKRL
tara:strand:- start:2721 stop:3953 length:1233 start_codon:yes stop_codon:yes gene_type:complete